MKSEVVRLRSVRIPMKSATPIAVSKINRLGSGKSNLRFQRGKTPEKSM
jgi:hypothetical protein